MCVYHSYLSVRVLAFFLSFDLTHTPSIIGICVGSTGRHLFHVVSFNLFKCPVPQVLYHHILSRSSCRGRQNVYRQSGVVMNSGIPHFNRTAVVLFATCSLMIFSILVEV